MLAYNKCDAAPAERPELHSSTEVFFIDFCNKEYIFVRLLSPKLHSVYATIYYPSGIADAHSQKRG
jgi:hypothetical protein